MRLSLSGHGRGLGAGFEEMTRLEGIETSGLALTPLHLIMFEEMTRLEGIETGVNDLLCLGVHGFEEMTRLEGIETDSYVAMVDSPFCLKR